MLQICGKNDMNTSKDNNNSGNGVFPNINNKFNFIGICYDDCVRKYKDSTKKDTYAHITLSVTHGKNTNLIPIIAYNHVAELASVVCRNGAKVAVTGYVITKERFDRLSGEIKIRVFFVATEVLGLVKPKKIRLGFKRFSELTELASIRDYEPPKPRK